jgi:hypothetical protein
MDEEASRNSTCVSALRMTMKLIDGGADGCDLSHLQAEGWVDSLRGLANLTYGCGRSSNRERFKAR